MFFSKIPKIIVAGSAVIDLIFRGPIFEERKKKSRLSLAFGGKYVCDEFFYCFGGGGANISHSLAKQGFPVFFWGYLGNDEFGKQAFNHLKKQKVITSLIEFKAKQTPLSAIILTPSGERTIINFRSDADCLRLNRRVLKQTKRCQWFILSSLVRSPKKEKLNILRQAKKAGMKIFLSLHGDEYRRGLTYLKPYFELADIVQINAHELADIFGADAGNFNFYKTNFSQKLNLNLLVVTYDLNGSFAYTKEEIYHQPIVKIEKVIDATGAGDAFAAGFIGRFLKTGSIKKALLFGAENSASVISELGAQNGFLKGI